MKRKIGEVLRKNNINAAKYGTSSIRGYKPLIKAGYKFLSGCEFCDYIEIQFKTNGNSDEKHKEIFEILSNNGFEVILEADCVKVLKY